MSQDVREVVLVIDMINDFCARDGAVYSERHAAIIPDMIAFLEEKRRQGVPIIFASDWHDPDYVNDPESHWFLIPHAARGSWGAEVVDELKRYPLTRALRPDKLCLAALQATLLHYVKGEAEKEIPVWRMISQPLDEAVEMWRKAAEIDPSDSDTRYNLALALSEQGEYAEAEEHFRASAKITGGLVLTVVAVCTQNPKIVITFSKTILREVRLYRGCFWLTERP